MSDARFKDFKWLNKSDIRFQDESMILYAPENSDFYCDNGSATGEGLLPITLSNAPFFFTEVTGDFVMRVKVEHEFKDIFDSSSIMVMKDETVWAKLCFELTDYNTHAVVSVVTKQYSDDANGSDIDGNTVWLQISRVGQAFGFHYSLDGEKFYMLRIFHLPVEDEIKVGFVPQAPTGKGGDRIYSNFTLEQRTVKNIRVGN